MSTSIHDVVRDRYGANARSMDTPKAESCCGPSNSASDCCGSASDAGCGVNLYDIRMLEGLPVDVTGLSLGCEGTQFTQSNASCCAA